MTTIDCNKEMKGYHADGVNLSNDDQTEMRNRRDSGRTRLKNGLTKAGHPLPKEFSSQGSYAMRTMVQDDACDYDIDDGVYFDKEDLKDADGGYLGARDARTRVRNALKDDRLAYDAVVKTNCVRQQYPDGYHIDIPVYRTIRSKDFWGNEVVEYELASGDDWVKSDARKVTRWYNDAVGSELKAGQSDTSQLRRITKLTKKMARSRVAWKKKTTSGICISKLVVDHFVARLDRDDDALRDTWKAIKAQLVFSQRIGHPVYADKNLAEEGDEGVIFFRDCLGEALETLKVLDEYDCTRKKAGDAWDKVFNTDYFSAQIAKDAATAKSLLQPAAAAAGLTFPQPPGGAEQVLGLRLMKWAMDDPARFLRERAELDHLEAEAGWLSTAWRMSEDGSIAVDLDMTIHGRVFAGRMTYPAMFPDSPPYICPRDKSERWSGHQYGAGGPLCLQWRADNWHPDVTGADMVRSAHELLSTEQHPELPNTVPSAHRLTEGQDMRGAGQRFVATTGLLATWTALPLSSRTRLKSAIVYNLGAVVMFAGKVADAQDVLQDVVDVPEGIATSLPLFSLSGDGWIFRSEVFDQRQSVEYAEALVRVLAEAGFATDDVLVQEAGKYKARTIVLLGTALPSLRVFLIDSGEQPELLEHRIVWPTPSDFRLSEETQRLANVRVGIVGLGSMGSKIAVSLARSGVRRFLLVDDDYLAPGNMVRHELSWAYVGTHKARAARDALSLIAAGVQVDTRTTRLAGQESAVTAAAALKDLSNCDLLIDATANPEVFLLLAALAKRQETPLCWGEIFAGGYGGMIARARPGRDPNPLAVRDAYHAYLATLPDAPFKNAAGYDGTEEQPLVAYDSDVGFVATALTRLAIDTALSRDPSEFPYSVYLLGMRREWIFEAPFDTRPVAVQGQGWERGEDAGSGEDRHAVVEALLRMYEGQKRADADPAA